jgi:carbon monoxide dehydrogenase subunit G
MPQITESFTVERPVETVWTFFQNVPEVAACMPGVELLETLDGETYKGKMKVKLGPISAQFQGQATIENRDEAGRIGVISARGADRQGGSRASAKVQYSLAPADAGTKVDIVADISLQGAMAQFGRTGLIQEVSGQLTKEFAGCIEQKLAAQSPEEAASVSAGEVKGFRVFIQGIWGWLKSLFARKSKS